MGDLDHGKGHKKEQREDRSLDDYTKKPVSTTKSSYRYKNPAKEVPKQVFQARRLFNSRIKSSWRSSSPSVAVRSISAVGTCVSIITTSRERRPRRRPIIAATRHWRRGSIILRSTIHWRRPCLVRRSHIISTRIWRRSSTRIIRSSRRRRRGGRAWWWRSSAIVIVITRVRWTRRRHRRRQRSPFTSIPVVAHIPSKRIRPIVTRRHP